MGSGTSKDNAVDKFEISDEEERGNSWGNENSEKKEQKTEVSVLGKVFGKPKTKPTTNLVKARTIVDLSSSESEDEYFKHKSDNDTKLRDDINSLEKTLSSLGLEKRVRQVRVNESRESRPPAYSSDSDGGYLTSSSAAVGGGGQKKQFRRRKDLRFSWDDRMSERQQEEWTVQKIQIEGFDPDKFRAANTRTTGGNSELVIMQTRASNGTLFPATGPPGYVPSYDPLEQQLLASIEQELGV